MWVRTFVLLVAILLAANLAPTAAQNFADRVLVDTPQLDDTVGTDDLLYIARATITPPDDGPTRAVDVCDAAIFVQSWFGTAIFGDAIPGTPPADAPVYRVDVEGDRAGTVGYVTGHHAEADATPNITYRQVPISPEQADPPPPQDPWFKSIEQVIDAFTGEAQLVRSQGVIEASSNTTPGASSTETAARAADPGSDADSSSPPGVWVVAAAGATGVGLAVR